MKKGAGIVQKRKGRDILDVTCLNDGIMYQKNMGGVDRGDQHRLMGAEFKNVSHFKKWYKKIFMRLCNLSLVNTFTAWNLAINLMLGEEG